MATDTGSVCVQSVTQTTGTYRVYNFEVEADHCFYVGDARILSHNTCFGAKLEPYNVDGGHHIPIKKAFVGAAGYDPQQALAIPQSELARLNISHSVVSGAQNSLYRTFLKTGRPLTWQVMQKIETGALVSAQMDPGMAAATVRKAINSLKAAGVAGPTRVPWGP